MPAGGARDLSEPRPNVVLVLNGDDRYAAGLIVAAAREGLNLRMIRDGPDLMQIVRQLEPDVILLDSEAGAAGVISLCRDVRDNVRAAVVVVSFSGRSFDATAALDAGADACVATPERPRELVARIRAVLRRTTTHASVDAAAVERSIEGGGVRLYPDRREAEVDGVAVTLPHKQFELLEVLLLNAGRVMVRESLIAKVWGSDYVGNTRTLDVHVKRLRRLIEDDPRVPRRIVTIRGVGYRFEAETRV